MASLPEMARAAERLERLEAAYEEAVQAHGEEAVEAARAAVALGEAHCDTGNVRQALSYLEKAVVTGDRSSVLEGRALANALETIAFVYCLLDDADREQRALERAIALQETFGDKESLAMCLISLADVLARRGDVKRKAALLNRAKELTADPGQQLVRSRLGAAKPSKVPKAAAGQDAAAERLLSLLLESSVTEHAGGRRGPARELELVECLRAAGQDIAGEGLTDLQRVQGIVQFVEQRHGDVSVQVAQWLALLAELYGAKGDFQKKRDSLRRVLKIQEHEFGFDSIYVSWTLKGLAHAEGKLGNVDARWELLQRGLEIQEELGALHPQTVTTRFFLSEANAERKMRKDPAGARELKGIFAQQPPTNPKVNRFAGEIVFPDMASQDGEEAPAAKGHHGHGHGHHGHHHFDISCTGGGSCYVREEGGIDVPYYFATEGATCH